MCVWFGVGGRGRGEYKLSQRVKGICKGPGAEEMLVLSEVS